jgi:hypothetical protein
MMTMLDPEFDPGNYGYKTFNSYISACSDIVRTDKGEYDMRGIHLTHQVIKKTSAALLRHAQDERDCSNSLKNTAHGELVEP